MKCLDSSFIIDFLRNKKSAIEKARVIEREELVTTHINMFEVLGGELRRHPLEDKHVTTAQAFFKNLTILPMNDLTALKASHLAAELSRKGININTQDILIAGILLAHHCTTIVTNDHDFEKIPGISVEKYA